MPVRDRISGPLAPGENPSLLHKALAGMTTGALGITIANPTEVVKVRLQGQGRLQPCQRIYSGSTDCYNKIIRKEGLRGLWAGVLPNMVRNSLISAVEITSYDQYR